MQRLPAVAWDAVSEMLSVVLSVVSEMLSVAVKCCQLRGTRGGRGRAQLSADPFFVLSKPDMFHVLGRFIFKRQFWQSMMIYGTSEYCAWLSML